MSEQKKIWMVRIGDHMCGPYETAAVESLIREQKVSEIDEVALPCRGWNYIRDRGEFIGTLESLKSNSFAKVSSQATSLTGTENITQLTGGDRTEELTFSKLQNTKTAPLVEFDALNLEQKPLEANVILASKRKKPKLIFLVIALGAAALAFFLFGPTDVVYNSMDLLRGQGKKTFKISWASGDYNEAFKLLNGDKNLLNKNRNKFAAITLMRGNEFGRAEKSLDLVTDKVSVEWKNLKGLAEQYSGKNERAESYYLSVLKKDQNYIPSLVNLGILKREVGEWSLAHAYFESAFSKVEKNGFDEVAFYLLETWMRQSLAESGVSNLSNIDAYLQNQMVGHSAYMHEFKLIELWMNATRSQWSKKEEVLTKAFLDLDPQILIERKVSPFTYKLQKGSLAYLCDDLNSKLKGTKYKKSVIALCFIMDGDYESAVSKLSTNPSSAYATTLYSFVAGLKKDFVTSDDQLIKAMEMRGGEDFTKFFLQARFCYEKGDMKCAAKYWMQGLDKDPNAYTAHTGLARSYFQVEDYEKTRAFMLRAEGFTKSYGPLIELQMLMKEVNQ